MLAFLEDEDQAFPDQLRDFEIWGCANNPVEIN